MSFAEASEQVLDHLRTLIPMSFWSVTAYDADSERQVYLHVRDSRGRHAVGDSDPWSETFCQHMVTGAAPQIAADLTAVPSYAAIRRAGELDIGAYIGVPIRAGDGRLFGTLCASDPHKQVDHVLQQQVPLLRLFATLLGQILASERWQREAEEREATLRWRAFHDVLTELPNRALFNDRLDQALALHERDGRPLVVLTLDVDDFKAVNDTFGHGGGDRLLTGLARRLRGAVRAADMVARLGGDEFAILLVGTGDTGRGMEAEQVADRILAALAEPFLVAGQPLAVGVSIGLAAVEPGVRTPTADELLAHADVALYGAKRDGKRRATVYDPSMRLPEVRDLQLRESLREAVEQSGIEEVR